MKALRYWLIPELLRISGEKLRESVFLRAIKRSRVRKFAMIPLVVLGVVWFFVQYRFAPLANPNTRILGYFLAATPGLIVMIVSVGATLAVRNRIRREVWIELSHLGVPTCLACGYNLTGNISGICPECGNTIKAMTNSTALRYIVHHHTAAPSGDHYDLMFERDGVLATWRSPLPLSQITASTEIERIGDHRLDYLSLSGPLSGDRGNVQPVESGVYRPAAQNDGHWEITAELPAGRRRFVLRQITGNAWRIEPV